LVNYLQLHPTYFIKISGHTDAKGSDEYNLKLSAGRAKSIANYLELNGIDSYRIQFEGNGSKEPIANNNTDKGREQNRRVEFIIFE
jgi:outer membrane protein OmpA-like peptidoglycan-associated protein